MGRTSEISEFRMNSAQWRGMRLARVTGSLPDCSAISSTPTSCSTVTTAARVLVSFGCSDVAIAFDSSSPSHRLSNTTGNPPVGVVQARKRAAILTGGIMLLSLGYASTGM
eukprot:scaffold114263_cov15-Tisochrysis_lutea.AAC.1